MDCAVLDFITKILWDICGTSSNRAVSSSLIVCCLFWWQMRFWFTFCAMGGPIGGPGRFIWWSTTNYHNGEYLETQNWVPSISENYILRSKVHKFTPNRAKGSIFALVWNFPPTTLTNIRCVETQDEVSILHF